MDVLQISTAVVIVLLAVAWYLSYSASRLDRLHAKVEGAMVAPTPVATEQGRMILGADAFFDGHRFDTAFARR